MLRRVERRSDRPLLRQGDPREVLQQLARERYPIYAQADITVESGEAAHQATVEAIIQALRARAAEGAPSL